MPRHRMTAIFRCCGPAHNQRYKITSWLQLSLHILSLLQKVMNCKLYVTLWLKFINTIQKCFIKCCREDKSIHCVLQTHLTFVCLLAAQFGVCRPTISFWFWEYNLIALFCCSFRVYLQANRTEVACAKKISATTLSLVHLRMGKLHGQIFKW